MARTLILSLVCSLSLGADLAAAQVEGEGVRLAALDPVDVGDDTYAEDFEGEDLDDEHVEFCGGGEETVVDLAYYALEADPAEARRMLVDALRRGDVDEWQRGYALSYLAEAQLRLGQYRSAVINYRKALAVDPNGVTQAARVGLASALYLAGASSAAHREARTAADAVCSDRWAQVPCYAAQRILARTARGDARAEASEAAQALRDAHEHLAASFDDVDARLRASAAMRNGAPEATS